MNIKDLKKLVAEIPKEMDNAEVILQKDAEGNGYSPLAGVDTNAVYVPDSTWSGDVYSKDFSADDNCMEKDEWEKIKANPKLQCVVLFPVN